MSLRIAVAVAALTLTASAASATTQTFVVDKNHSEAGFKVRHLLSKTPGRFNVLHHGEATIVLDYGHNPSALLALVDAIAQLPHRRRLTVFSK